MRSLAVMALLFVGCQCVAPQKLREDIRHSSVLSVCQSQDEIVLINECYTNFMSTCLDNPNNRLTSCEDVAKSRCTVIKCIDIPKEA